MKKFAGIWLDHRQAIVVCLKSDPDPFDEAQESVEIIESDVERKVRLSGGSRSHKTPYGPQETSVDGKMEDRIKRHLKKYYQNIIQRIEDSDRLYIFGPGEAKIELRKEIEKKKAFASKKLQVETADKMTEKQIAARVREFFARQR